MCHSRDNLGVYSDGHVFCFGCGYRKEGKRTLNNYKGTENNKNNAVFDNYRFTSSLDNVAYSWLKKYDITSEEIERYRLLWEDDRKWLVFPFFENGQLVCINCRNFGEGRKYYTFGKRTHFHAWGQPEADTVVFVEDCVSAIKVGRSCSSHPLLGAHVPAEALNRAMKRFSRVGVWLDADKAREALKTASKASLAYPGRVFCVRSDLDPKEYDRPELFLGLTELSEEKIV